MGDFWAQLWTGIEPILLEALKAIAAVLLSVASAMIIKWASGEKKKDTIAEAVVLAETAFTAPKSGPKKLKAVKQTLADVGVKATTAAIEVQVAKLTKK